MSNVNINWEELGISNDFLFKKVMQNPELCKEMLQIILPELDIERIEYPESEKTIEQDKDAHGVRLDIYIRDDKGTIYNAEMQVAQTWELPKRSRYYSSMIDLQLLDKAKSYNKLNKSFVIFICPFDVFGKGRHIYTFRNICEEDTNVYLGDETTKIFLNANGTMDDVNSDLKAFLNLVVGKSSDHPFVKKLETAVAEAKEDREWRREIMTLLMKYQEKFEEGKEIGEEKGEERLSELIRKLIETNRSSEVIKVTCDKEYRHKLYKEYNIK